MIFEDFFIKGYAKGMYDNESALSFFDSFVFQDAELVDRRPPPGSEKALNDIATFMKENYINQIFDDVTIKQVSMWQSVDGPSSDWHNDRYYKKIDENTWEGHRFNSNILIYLDKNSKEIGNSIEFKNQNEEFIEYPSRGDFVWINQSQGFQHRATHKQGSRRVLSFEYYIPALPKGDLVHHGLDY